MSDKLVVAYVDPALTIATIGCTMVTICTGPTTMTHVQKLTDHMALLHRTTAKNILGMTIINVASSTIDSKVRQALMKMTEASKDRSAAAALVFDGNGFMAAALRAAVGALMIGSRAKYPTQAFPDVLTAVDWLGTFNAPKLTPVEKSVYAREINELYRQIVARMQQVA